MFLVGVVLCALMGAELGAVLTGALRLGTGVGVVLFVVGLNLAPWTGLVGGALLAAGSRRGRPGEGPAAFRTAPARIESVQAGGEAPDLTLRLDLTVAPEGAPAYRVHARTVVNIMDLDDFKAGRIVQVDHDPARPWDVRVRRRPDAAGATLIALAKFDRAPEQSRATPPPRTGTGRARRVGGYAVLAGFLVSLWPLLTLWGPQL